MRLGKAFADAVIQERRTSLSGARNSGPSWWVGVGRTLVFASVLLVSLFLLIWRLVELTIIHGHEYRRLADGNRIRELIRHAPRGRILDRTGKPLVVNLPSFRLVSPCEGEATGVCTGRLSPEEAKELTKSGLPKGQYLEVDWIRQYQEAEGTAHVVGYTGELSAAELKEGYYKLRNYRSGDRVGRLGAEATFEEKLRGRDGKELVEVDATGKVLRTLGRQEEVPGEDIALSLDAGLARAVVEAFPVGERGAVVVGKPTTGEILALFSSPSFSPNKLSLGMSQDEYQAILESPDQPLFNRSIGGVYPPGSTFKIITALAGLEEGALTKTTTVEDTGVITIGPFTFPNWYFIQYGKTEGTVDLVRAIQRSNDIFFYKVGEWTGITKIAEWARRVGIGKTRGIELPGEASGLMPDPEWKSKRFTTDADLAARNDEWYLGDTYHVAIGQGYLLTTPLQVNEWTNVVANRGRLCQPTIRKSQISNLKSQKEKCKDLGIKKETIDLITEGMRRACEPGGTGWPLFNFTINKLTHSQIDNAEATTSSQRKQAVAIPVACKTGTAEFGDPKNRTHAWFTVFAPLPSRTGSPALSGEPEISVTVLVEGAGEGSSVAAPIAKKVLEEWFSR